MKYFWYFVLFIIVLATGLWMIILAFWLFYWMCRGIYGLYKIIKPNNPYERPRPFVFDGKIEDGLKVSPIQLVNAHAQDGYDSKASIIDKPIENNVEKGQPLCDDILDQKVKGSDVMAIYEMEEKESLIEYLSRFNAKDIASSPACGMRIMKEFSDMPFPEEWHSPWDIVGMDLYEVMGYLVEPDSIEYGDYCETHFFNVYGGHYLVLIVVDDGITGICWG